MKIARVVLKRSSGAGSEAPGGCADRRLRYLGWVRLLASTCLLLGLAVACSGGGKGAAKVKRDAGASPAQQGKGEGQGSSAPKDGGTSSVAKSDASMGHCTQAADCDDGVFCNGQEDCAHGACAAGTAPALNDGVSCTVDRCDERLGRVTHTPQDSACDDGKLCNGIELCDTTAGCQPGTAVMLDDGIDCTADRCDESTASATHTPDDALCDDGDPCTHDLCDVMTGCAHRHDGNACPCAPGGACNPFVTDACGTSLSCRPGGSGTECLSLTTPTLQEGDSCTKVSDQFACALGTFCTDLGAGPKCVKMCPKDSSGMCSAGQACTGAVSGESCVRACQPFPKPCDVLAQDCPDANDTCTFASNPETGAPYTGCRPAGAKGLDQSCGAGNGSCDHRLVCVATQGVPTCREICDPAVSPPTCHAQNETCSGRSTSYGVSYCR